MIRFSLRNSKFLTIASALTLISGLIAFVTTSFNVESASLSSAYFLIIAFPASLVFLLVSLPLTWWGRKRRKAFAALADDDPKKPQKITHTFIGALLFLVGALVMSLTYLVINTLGTENETVKFILPWILGAVVPLGVAALISFVEAVYSQLRYGKPKAT